MKKTAFLILFSLLALLSYSQDLDFSNRGFLIKSNRFELIKWVGMDRNSIETQIETIITYHNTEKILEIVNSQQSITFHITNASFDGIDKTTFTSKEGAIINFIPEFYLSYSMQEAIDTEYYYGDLH